MSWTTPRTWVAGEALTAALLNTHVRDNLNFLKGAAGTVTFDDVIKFSLNRKGGSTSNWESGGTSTYAETGVFVQAGCYQTTFSGSTWGQVTINLPVALNAANLGLSYVSRLVQNAENVRISAAISGTTGVTFTWMVISGTTALFDNDTVNWLVIGK